MKGTKEDWEKLVEKTEALEKILSTVMEDVELGDWFRSTKQILSKLLDTFNGNPDKEWWGHILSWNRTHGSGEQIVLSIAYNWFIFGFVKVPEAGGMDG